MFYPTSLKEIEMLLWIRICSSSTIPRAMLSCSWVCPNLSKSSSQKLRLNYQCILWSSLAPPNANSILEQEYSTRRFIVTRAKHSLTSVTAKSIPSNRYSEQKSLNVHQKKMKTKIKRYRMSNSISIMGPSILKKSSTIMRITDAVTVL